MSFFINTFFTLPLHPRHHVLSWVLEISQSFLPQSVRCSGTVGELGRPLNLMEPSLFLPANPAPTRKSMSVQQTHKVLATFFLCICTVACLGYEQISPCLSTSSSVLLSFVKPFPFLVARKPRPSSAFTLLYCHCSPKVWTEFLYRVE